MDCFGQVHDGGDRMACYAILQNMKALTPTATLGLGGAPGVETSLLIEKYRVDTQGVSPFSWIAMRRAFLSYTIRGFDPWS